MDYPLVNLVAWTRRQAGDTLKATNQSFSSDGTATLTLNASGFINVKRIDVAGTTLEPGDYSSTDNVVTLATAPAELADVIVFFDSAKYSDAEILNFILDACRGVAGDMLFTWVTDDANAVIHDADGNLFDPKTNRPRPEIEQLLVFRAGAYIFADKTNQSAGDAILIKNGQTTINTSLTAGANEKALVRLMDSYEKAMLRARSHGFMGSAQAQTFDHYYPRSFGWGEWRYPCR